MNSELKKCLGVVWYIFCFLTITTAVWDSCSSESPEKKLQREALTRGFAYYTNNAAGKAVFTWREK